jgi:hypothetical protein
MRMKVKVIIKETNQPSRVTWSNGIFYANPIDIEFGKPFGSKKNYIIYLVADYSVNYFTSHYMNKNNLDIRTSGEIVNVNYYEDIFYKIIASSEVVVYSPFVNKICDGLLSRILSTIKENETKEELEIELIRFQKDKAYSKAAVDVARKMMSIQDIEEFKRTWEIQKENYITDLNFIDWIKLYLS